MRYFVTLDGDTHAVSPTAGGLRIDDRELEADLVRVDGGRAAHLRIGDRGFSLFARRVNDGWRIQLGGREFHLEVEDERARAIRELTGGAGARASSPELRAPMPGLVVKVLVEPGQRVEPGTGLVVVEAMKMENELRSEGAGVVAGIEVGPGQTVNRDDVLIRFEAEGATQPGSAADPAAPGG